MRPLKLLTASLLLLIPPVAWAEEQVKTPADVTPSDRVTLAQWLAELPCHVFPRKEEGNKQ